MERRRDKLADKVSELSDKMVLNKATLDEVRLYTQLRKGLQERNRGLVK